MEVFAETLFGGGIDCSVISRMAEAGVPESTIMALAGHVSRKMLERYSHIGMVAKRKAVEVLNAPATQTHGAFCEIASGRLQ